MARAVSARNGGDHNGGSVSARYRIRIDIDRVMHRARLWCVAFIYYQTASPKKRRPPSARWRRDHHDR